MNRFTLLFITCCSAAFPLTAQTPCFNNPVTYGAGGSCQAIASGYVDAGTTIDLVVTNSYVSGTVSVLTGNGNGTFGSSTAYSCGQQPYDVILADFNGDSWSDIATANAGGTMSVLLNNGSGGFQAAVDYTAGTNPMYLAAADFNQDGKQDVVVSNIGTGNKISVFTGNGNGTFQTQVQYTAALDPRGVTTGLFNNDIYPDIAVSIGIGGQVGIFLNNGNGTFQSMITYACGSLPQRLIAGHFNTDNFIDLAVANWTSNNVSVLAGNGDGTFQAAVNYAVESHPTAIMMGNYDTDNVTDLAVMCNSNYKVSVLPGTGTGGFLGALHYNAGGNYGLASAKFDGTGPDDLACVSSTGGTAKVLLNCIVTGMEKGTENSGMMFFPNPFSDAATLELPDDAALQNGAGEIAISDLPGKIVRRIPVQGKSVRIERSGLPAGIYFLHLLLNGEAEDVKKIMIE